ncbi:hypothetical protein JD844_014099 [Phrynosoma platyrhinos]|uniref:CRAL-TRIO domain-containing protein n=1 Tax=Phrynosoma platyrhinos TaxID=52577 RepID=A0ABQ7SR13_PHRPL|nr:hypothetical protein JD844_014099 [Phrynosoma platyrhinos]
MRSGHFSDFSPPFMSIDSLLLGMKGCIHFLFLGEYFRGRVETLRRGSQHLTQKGGILDQAEAASVIEATLRMEGVELKEEWQDEDFPRPLPEDDHIEDLPDPSGRGDQPEVNGNKVKKKLLAPNINLTLDRSEGSILSDLDDSKDIDLDDIDTPSENSNEFEWEDDLPKPKTTDVIRKGSFSEYAASDEKEEERRWRMFRIGDQDHRVDMKAIEPYKKVISHGGKDFLAEACLLYVIGTLELLVAENYMIVYLNGATTRRKMPSLGWLRKCYQQIDRRLRKNLKSLIIVHPSWFIRTLLAITKPFISSKFSQKIKYVFTLAELAEIIPMEYVGIPECIKQYEEEKFKKKAKRLKNVQKDMTSCVYQNLIRAGDRLLDFLPNGLSAADGFASPG